MKIFSHKDILAIEKLTLHERGISQDDFISEAGKRMGYEILANWNPERRIVIFAGPALNGAYALNAAIELAEQGANPQIFLFNIGGNRLTPNCQEAKRKLEMCSAQYEFVEFTGITFSMPEISKETLVVDGIFGSELLTSLPRGYQQLVRNINESGAEIISLELPSGLPADSTVCLISRNVIHADITLDLGLPRLSFFMPENYELTGKCVNIKMEFSENAIRKVPGKYYLVEQRDIRRLLPVRGRGTDKSDYGHALLFAGSYGMTGASMLATEGALRSGCGKVTCHGPECSRIPLQTALPSAMFDADPDERIITDMNLSRHYDAIGIGPGIGTSDATIATLESFLKVAYANNRSLVLDADALNCIALRPAMMEYLPPLTIITPHAGEFDKLFGPHPSSEARLDKALEMADLYKIIIVLKGHHTAIVRPDRRVFFNSTGSSALAKGGTGDLLTGLITGLIASHVKPEIAAVIGVYIHGMAGDICQNTLGEYSVTASDVAKAIGKAFLKVC